VTGYEKGWPGHLAATWPAAETRIAGGCLVRQGGGGRRVSSALAVGPELEVEAAEAAMIDWDQTPQFQIWPGQDRLDAGLAERGYLLHTPTVVLEAPTAALASGTCDERTIFCEGILTCMAEIWAAGGIDAARLAVMARVPSPKVFLLGRLGDRPAACAFVAIDGDVAMLHALHVDEAARRNRLATRITRAGAAWGRDRGASRFGLAVGRSNAAALAAYARLGMSEASHYHYRVRAGGQPRLAAR
jgi:N-acetylglutamate synthase